MPVPTTLPDPALITDPTTLVIRYRYSDIDGHEWFVEPAVPVPLAGRPGCETYEAGTGYGMDDAIRRARKWVAANCDCDPMRVPLAKP